MSSPCKCACHKHSWRGMPFEMMSTEHIANSLAYAIRMRYPSIVDSIPYLHAELGKRLQPERTHYGYNPWLGPPDEEIPF